MLAKILSIAGFIVIAPALVVGALMVGAFLLLIVGIFFTGLFEMWHWMFCFLFRRPYVKYFDI